MIAAHQAWFAEKTGLPSRQWVPSFTLAKEAAQECLIELCTECLASNGFLPPEIEFDDYACARNLVLASALAVTDLNGLHAKVIGAESAQQRLESLLSKRRLFSWGESAIPHLLAIQWYCEKRNLEIDTFPELESVIAELCDRNHPRAEDVAFAPPLLSADDVMADLFRTDPTQPPNRRAPGTWTLEALMEFFARRNHREFLDKSWRKISRLDLLLFQPESTFDLLVWECAEGHESVRKPEMKQSWSALRNEAMRDRSQTLPRILQTDSNFGLMFLLTYPHRLSAALVRTLDAESDKRTNPMTS
jgi:hypothetical protein